MVRQAVDGNDLIRILKGAASKEGMLRCPEGASDACIAAQSDASARLSASTNLSFISSTNDALTSGPM